MGFNPVFQKIKTFVEKELDYPEHNILIKETSDGFCINNLTIKKIDNFWVVSDIFGNELNSYHYARLAFLSTFAIIKLLILLSFQNNL